MIQIEQLCKSYGSVEVLKDISFTVKAGDVFGIVGHSGAGKSTLLRCLNGLEGYDGGSVQVMGLEVANLSAAQMPELRRNMGMIFQNFSLMARKSVFDNVAFPLQIWKAPAATIRPRVMELLDLVGLADRHADRIQNLSGGQKQRVGIARALALSPKILLCDEATSALDPVTTIAILDLLRDINRSLGLTMVVVTHQMEVVKRICNRLLLLEGGKETCLGGTEDLFLSTTPALTRFVEEEYALIPSGVNIRMVFPREISQQSIITTMARDLDLSFSIVGGKLERYQDDVLGFLIINVERSDLERVRAYMTERSLHFEELPAHGECA